MPKVIPNSTMRYIGIDPGAGGGLAVIRWGERIFLERMPPTEMDLLDTLRSRCDLDPDSWRDPHISACIEKVTGYVGGVGNPGSAMFKFGCSYGRCTMALTSLGISYTEVVPRTWQKAVGIAPRGKTESKTEFKNRLKRRAQQLYPWVEATLATCDALLIAHYCYLQEKQK